MKAIVALLFLICAFVITITLCVNRKIDYKTATVFLAFTFLCSFCIGYYDKVKNLNIDFLGTKVNAAIKEIDDYKQIAIVEIQKDVDSHKKQLLQIKDDIEKQKKIALLWSMGTSAFSSGNFEFAVEDFEEILKFEPDNIDAMEFCGHALLQYAYRTCGKDEKPEVLLKANRVWTKLVGINESKYAAEMACVFSLQRNEEQCKYWLQKANQANTLPPKSSDLYKMLLDFCKKEWFMALNWEKEK